MATTLLAHAAYISWSSRAVRQANEAWRRRGHEDDLMTREGLHHHLFRWAVKARAVHDPGLRPRARYSVYVAQAFERDPEDVKEAARDYWKLLVRQHATI